MNVKMFHVEAIFTFFFSVIYCASTTIACTNVIKMRMLLATVSEMFAL